MSGDSAYAAAPFDHAKADVILRSFDNIDFRVFKLFLSLASPFFETLFNIPQPVQESEDQEIRDGLVVIPVTEDSKTLDALLRFSYPCTLADDPNIEVLKDAMDVLEAAKKYSLDAIEKKARQAISSPKILEAEPLRCFAMARQRSLWEETLLAARYTLTQPLIPAWFQEIELITATDLLSLLTYHQKCGEAVYALRLDLSWIISHYGSSAACAWLSGQSQCQPVNSFNQSTGGSISYRKCGCPRPHKSRFTLFGMDSPQWWEEFMEETFIALRDKPCKETAQASVEKTIQTVRARNCQACSPNVAEGMRDLSDLFTRKIEETVSQIELDFSVPTSGKVHSGSQPGQEVSKKGRKRR